ncbi:hypothetical protein PV10_07100 [Exophiala mesophila]|uniref:Deacetylase sirtuin-type domain-containing protein n=1 Tax=Exophiala mesophila TaxID=212818 RepID=A0A0D1WL39_EXOME|nr:uncharacterized protein PV10_07100 [Exophiala mesophila]KIV89720.1 hypothetical protein PV10_07100 [Exophiala mesophila]
MDRAEFQSRLAALNPAWAEFLAELLKTGALDTEDPVERRSRGFKTNPDGDADVPGAPYSTFRYPACPSCVKRPPVVGSSSFSSSSGGGKGGGGEKLHVQVDADGAWIESNQVKKGGSSPSTSTTTAPGILKPNVIMFGESIPARIKAEAESAIDSANRILVVGSSLATYSAWRLVKRAADRSMPIAILNMGGVRKEDAFFNHIVPAASFQEQQQQQTTSAMAQRFAIGVEQGSGKTGDSDSGLNSRSRSSSSGLGPVRASLPAEEILPGVVQEVKRILGSGH